MTTHSKDEIRRAACFHEAGHAVAEYWWLAGVATVEVPLELPVGAAEGYLAECVPAYSERTYPLRFLIYRYLAGQVAEAIAKQAGLIHVTTDEIWSGAYAVDETAAREELDRHSQAETLDYYRTEIEAQLQPLLAPVAAVAYSLEQYVELRGGQVAELVFGLWHKKNHDSGESSGRYNCRRVWWPDQAEWSEAPQVALADPDQIHPVLSAEAGSGHAGDAP